MRTWLLFGASEALLTLAAQTQLLPDNLIGILAQLPLVAVIIWLEMRNKQWLEHMLAVQRQSLKEIYDSRNAFLDTLLKSVDSRQTEMRDQVERMENQMVIFAGMLAEVAKMDDLVDRLMDKINTTQRGDKS